MIKTVLTKECIGWAINVDKNMPHRRTVAVDSLCKAICYKLQSEITKINSWLQCQLSVFTVYLFN